ncbi:MAG: SoxR reducing system RseC family protein [Pseudomonadota bacterium]
MIEERAVILSVSPDSHNLSDSIATLEIERKTACGLCGQTRGCGNSIWGKLFSHQSTAFKAQNRINAKVGDSVIVSINERALLKSALLLYILPLATMIIGAILMNGVMPNNAAAMLGALAGLVLGLVWVKGHTTASAYFLEQQPVILRMATQETEIKFS